MEEDREYHLGIRGNILRFRTGAFRAEAGSALHSGIYNRELVSSLASGAVLVIMALVAVLYGVSIGKYHYIAAIVLFAVLTLVARVYIFYEEYLDLSIDRNKGLVNVFIKKMRVKRVIKPLNELTGVMKGYVLLAPENLDGVDFVKRISMQHGMVIPGFGETKEYHSVHLEFGDLDTLSIFCTEDQEVAEAVYQVIKKFIGGSGAKTQ